MRSMWAATHVGLIRSLNEDRCCVGDWISHRGVESRSGLISCSRGWAVIADGMGGHEAGELASAAAIATIREMIGDAGSEFEIVRVLERANERIFEEMFDGRGRPAMGSTAVGISFQDDHVFVFNVGDSRLYTVQDGNLVQQSVDDTLAAVTPAQRSRSHALTQSLGGTFSRLPLHPHVKRLKTLDRKQFLLCSDGLTDMLSDDEIASPGSLPCKSC